jgi:hypothetical protein
MFYLRQPLIDYTTTDVVVTFYQFSDKYLKICLMKDRKLRKTLSTMQPNKKKAPKCQMIVSIELHFYTD